MKNVYLIRHYFSGPDNISINQLTFNDLEEILLALRIADNYVPIASMNILRQKIETFIGIHKTHFANCPDCVDSSSDILSDDSSSSDISFRPLTSTNID